MPLTSMHIKIQVYNAHNHRSHVNALNVLTIYIRQIKYADSYTIFIISHKTNNVRMDIYCRVAFLCCLYVMLTH